MSDEVAANKSSPPVIPIIQPGEIQDTLDELHNKYRLLQAGTLATYIPELAKMDPDLFSICIVTVDGQCFKVGDFHQLFTIQSISKVFVYGLALAEHGREQVLAKVGVEPTGDAFNAIILDEKSKRPYNPMVNAGAIAITSLIKGKEPTERLSRMLSMFEGYIGHETSVDMLTFMSERTTGHRNRAMAHVRRCPCNKADSG